MGSEPCGICHNLNDYALNGLKWNESQLHYFALKKSAEKCLYCRIILNGLELSGLDKECKAYSLSNYRTFRLTLNDLLARSGVERRLEFYLDTKETEQLKEQNCRPVVHGAIIPQPDAIKPRPKITPFWENRLRSQLLQWIGVPQDVGFMPRRVLDLGKEGVNLSGEVRLFETQYVSAAYAALSHCWVDRNILTTTTSTLATRQSSIPFTQLPPTFQEAAMACRWLGIQYLWIDSLCIIQDDSLDWEEQASQMANIYESAFLTLAAHGGAAAKCSILPKPPEYDIPTSLSMARGTIKARVIPVHDFLSPAGVVLGGIGENPPDRISGRGWCYQERILSSQILHFTSFEVLHEDHKGRIRCQCGDDHCYFLPTIKRPVLKNARDPQRLWRDIVEQYTMKAFTRQWDILPGIAGIASRFQQYYQPGEYLAGLWENDLAKWICWKSVRIPLWGALDSGCERCGVWPRRISDQPPVANYMIPSFSWASRFGACEFLNEAEMDQMVEIRHTRCEPVRQNPLGRFTACSVGLRGLALDMKVISTKGKDREFVQGCRTEFVYLTMPGVVTSPQAAASEWFESARLKAIQFDFDAIDDIPEDWQSVKVLQIFRGNNYSISLVLRASHPDHTNTRRTYRRVGICDVIPKHYFDTAAQQDLELV